MTLEWILGDALLVGFVMTLVDKVRAASSDLRSLVRAIGAEERRLRVAHQPERQRCRDGVG